MVLRELAAAIAIGCAVGASAGAAEKQAPQPVQPIDSVPWLEGTASMGFGALDSVANSQAAPGGQLVGPAGSGTASSPPPAAAQASAAKPNPCAQSHKGVFYNNDFSYLKEGGAGCCLGDCLKLMPVAGGDWGTLDVGGQLRERYHHEEGMGQDVAGPGAGRFQFNNHDFVLTRLRLYANWKISDRVRIYQEGIFADVSDDGGTYLPRLIDRNYGDFLNLFADVTVVDGAVLRVGRQELLYGAERLVSPLDWANTRRTFDGARVLLKGDDWTSDGFYTYVVPVDPNDLDEPDYNQSFYGLYNSYTGIEDLTVDAYYLGYENETTSLAPSGQGDFSIHTLGLRLNAALTESWLFECEGGPQFGRQSGLALDHEAAFGTVGIGRKLGDLLPWSPTLWGYYDYASGNNVGGDFNRFNQLFPLGHKYFGFIDAVQRSNIEAPNVLLTATPAKDWTLLAWYWHFMANQENDIVPSIGGTPPQSATSKDLGDELDLTVRYNIAPRSNVLVGWSHFWRGNKILAPNDADFLYSQWELNF
ncbi:MAG: alginate export family protein [Pirellulales bacterium]|nr:alginate export family protein [Pirellulales bacterium]